MIRRLLTLCAIAGIAGCGADTPLRCEEDVALGLQAQPDDARPLSADTPSSGLICGFERDWWVFTADDGCALGFDLTFDDADGDLGLSLYVLEPDPNLIDQSFTEGDAERVSIGGSEARAYYPEVRAQGGRAGAARAEYSLVATLDCGELPTTTMPTTGGPSTGGGPTSEATASSSSEGSGTAGPTDTGTTTEAGTSSSTSSSSTSSSSSSGATQTGTGETSSGSTSTGTTGGATDSTSTDATTTTTTVATTG